MIDNLVIGVTYEEQKQTGHFYSQNCIALFIPIMKGIELYDIYNVQGINILLSLPATG